MLYAELHRKVDADAAEAQRLEDVLTSTVFGTLFATGPTDVLVSWLRRARLEGYLRIGIDSPFGYWFWPRLSHVEPDLLIRLGDQLLIVEAKYRARESNRSIPAEVEDESEAPARRQLERQWASLTTEFQPSLLQPSLRQAVRECAGRLSLVYLVSMRKIRTARRELQDNLALCPEMRAGLLTWEDLHLELQERLAGRRNVPSDWRADLLRYLESRGLVTFYGFARRTPALETRTLARLASRRSQLRPRRRFRFGQALRDLSADDIQLLQRMAGPAAAPAPAKTEGPGLPWAMSAEQLRLMKRLGSRWGAPPRMAPQAGAPRTLSAGELALLQRLGGRRAKPSRGGSQSNLPRRMAAEDLRRLARLAGRPRRSRMEEGKWAKSN